MVKRGGTMARRILDGRNNGRRDWLCRGFFSVQLNFFFFGQFEREGERGKINERSENPRKAPEMYC